MQLMPWQLRCATFLNKMRFKRKKRNNKPVEWIKEDSIKERMIRREKFSKNKEKKKEKGYEVVEIENFSESLTSQLLFNDKVLFVTEKPKLINLEKVTQDYNLLIWLDKAAPAKILKSLPKETNI